jgi:hypothetical protein
MIKFSHQQKYSKFDDNSRPEDRETERLYCKYTVCALIFIKS